MQKRADLQGIRGIAIVSVLLYHFFPAIFKNGYVGVDQFFILSGFLMAEILSRNESISFSNLGAFYYRRMKRILPLYVLFILSTLSITLLVFEFPFFTYNIPYAVRSLGFISNTASYSGGATYAELLADAQDLFTHTWSLSCEVQFYVIAPFLILVPFIPYKKTALCFIGIASFLVFTYFMESGRSDFAFNLMPTRIWQFVMGDPELQNAPKSYITSLLSNLLFVLLIVSCWHPVEVTPHLVRLVVCILTTCLIYFGASHPNMFLSTRPLVYMGDISYSLYLIHWPVRVYLKQNQFTSLNESLLAMVCCIALAALVYETYEKFYLKMEKTGIIILVCALYFMCGAVIFTVSPPTIFNQETDVIFSESLLDIPENLTVEAAIKLNNNFGAMDGAQWNIKECVYETPTTNPPWGTLCTFNKTEFTGNKRILLIGNSYATNMGRMIIRLNKCQQKAKSIQMFTLIGCEVIDNTGLWASHCANKTEDFYAVVEKVKPDILFILSRQMTAMRATEGPVDTILNTEKELLERLENNVKDRVYIFNSLPEHIGGVTFISSINKGLKEGEKVSQESLLNKAGNYTLGRQRMELLSKQCQKCKLVDVMPTLTENGIYQFYDENTGLEYFTGDMHFSDYGLEKISSVFGDKCSKIRE